MPPPRRKGFEVDYSTLVSASGDPLSAASIAIYRAALNKLAAAGFKTKKDLLDKQKEVVKSIEERLPEKAKRRVALSAIFRVLQDVPNDKREAYYQAFQRAKD